MDVQLHVGIVSVKTKISEEFQPHKYKIKAVLKAKGGPVG